MNSFSTSSFAVNLKAGEDALLHLNPRISNGNGYVVLNSCIKGQWGQEDRSGNMPFKVGSHFNIQIITDENKYIVRSISTPEY